MTFFPIFAQRESQKQLFVAYSWPHRTSLSKTRIYVSEKRCDVKKQKN